MSAAKETFHEQDDVAERGVTSGTFPKVAGTFDEHGTLSGMLDALEEADLEGARVQLAGLMLFLERHFEREERPGGFFDTVLDTAPHYQARVRALREEHAIVLSRVDGLLVDVYDAAMLSEELASWIADIIALLRSHERREHALMQLSLQVDIAAGD